MTGATGDAPHWRALLEEALRRLDHLASSPASADALVVVIGRAFGAAAPADPGFAAVGEALAAGRMLLPVLVDGARMPGAPSLPPAVRPLADVEAVDLREIAQVPGIAARLAIAARRVPGLAPAGDARRVFVSYRRDDGWYWASLLARALAMRVGAGNVFFDLGALEPGVIFREAILARLRAATDVAVLVGPAFLAPGAGGQPRIAAAEDFVRLEIREALAAHKALHVVLGGGATMPDPGALPADVAPAFRTAVPLELSRFDAADPVADALLRRAAPPAPLVGGSWRAPPSMPVRPGVGGVRPAPRAIVEYMARRQQREQVLAGVVKGLAALGWTSAGIRGDDLLLARPDEAELRFRLDTEHCELVLEERGRSLRRLGLRGWIARAIFSVSPDALADLDLLRLPDRLVEAAENPRACLARTGRVDLGAGPQPPVRLGDMDRLLRPFWQPSTRALEAFALAQAATRARGGPGPLVHEREILLGEDATVRALAADPTGGRIAAASDRGVWLVDLGSGTLTPTGVEVDADALAWHPVAGLAVAGSGGRLWLLDAAGRAMFAHRGPYGLWRRLVDPPRIVGLAWSDDGRCLACCTGDAVWIFEPHRRRFRRLPFVLENPVGIERAGIFFAADDAVLVVMARGSWLWRVSRTTGEVLARRDVSRGHALFDPVPRLVAHRQGGLQMYCLAPAPAHECFAVGGNDAQVVLFETDTLEPAAYHVWHPPLAGKINGQVMALAFSPDGRSLASVGNDRRLVVADLASGDALLEGFLAGLPLLEAALCWSADGTHLASAVGNAIELWRVPGGSPRPGGRVSAGEHQVEGPGEGAGRRGMGPERNGDQVP